MASWLQNQFRQVEDFLETVDRTAATVAVIRERSHAEKTKSRIDEQLAALEPAGLRRTGVGREKASGGRTAGKQPRAATAETGSKASSVSPRPQLVDTVLTESKGLSQDLEDRSKAGSVAGANGFAVATELSEAAAKSEVAETVPEEEKDGPGSAEQKIVTLEAVEPSDSRLGPETADVGAADAGNGDNSSSSEDQAATTATSGPPGGGQVSEQEGNGGQEGENPPGRPNGTASDAVQAGAEGAPSSSGVYEEEATAAEEEEAVSVEAQLDSEEPKVPKTVAVQRELDEARGLLKSAPSVAQSKEARLARICASLSQRLQEYKAENAQLEELLSAERSGRGDMDSTVRVLQQQLAQAQAELVMAEASTASALAAKNGELEALNQALAESTRQAAVFEGQLASLQANTEVIAKNRDVTEARMIQALREELSAAERRFEEERGAHTATRQARGLLKSAPSVAQSKEARLARICASLSQRLQEYKAENAQLEELLSAERSGRGDMDSTVRVLQQQLAQAQAELVMAEASTASALAAKNGELEALNQALAESTRQAAVFEGQLASLQANTEVIAKNRDVTEARMIQALREELSAAERRFEEERGAHTATRQTAAQREIELEQRVTESAAGLTRMQRALDERTQKATDLEDKISMLEVECAALNQELQAAEARSKREQKRPSEDPSVSAQVQAWREEAERARHMQHEAEAKLQAMEAETQKLRVEMEARKREVDGSSSLQAHAELEKRFRELTELLYLKQTQLEAMASEKQAALLHLEKETRRFREAKAQAERDRTTKRVVSTMDDDDQELRSFESLGLHQRQIVGPRIQQAAKLLDHGTVTAGRFLWRRPLARLGVFFYLVFVHLFLMYLLHRLQEQADDIISRDNASIEAEAASGLVKPVHSSSFN